MVGLRKVCKLYHFLIERLYTYLTTNIIDNIRNKRQTCYQELTYHRQGGNEYHGDNRPRNQFLLSGGKEFVYQCFKAHITLLFIEEREIIQVEAEEDSMLWCVAILFVKANKLGLHVVVGIAKVDGTHRNPIAQCHSAEIADAKAALVDIFIGAYTGVGNLAAPNVQYAVCIAPAVGHPDAVLLHLGVVDVEAKV